MKIIFFISIFASIAFSSFDNNLTTGVTTKGKPAGQAVDDHCYEFQGDYLQASMGDCVESSNWYDGTIKTYYCGIAPLLDEWAWKQRGQGDKNEYCWIAVGEFIAPPGVNGDFVPTMEQLNTLNPLNAHTIEAMQGFFNKYPDIFYAGDVIGNRQAKTEGLPQTFTHENTFAVFTIKLGNSTKMLDEWKSGPHSYNIAWSAHVGYGSTWKGKVVNCNDFDPRGVFIFDEHVENIYLPAINEAKNIFPTELLAEASKRPPPGEPSGDQRKNITYELIPNEEDPYQVFITVRAPLNRWFGFGITKTNKMEGGFGIIYHETGNSEGIDGVFLGGYDISNISIVDADSISEIEVYEYQELDTEQRIIFNLKLDDWTDVKFIQAFGKNYEFSYHYENKQIVDPNYDPKQKGKKQNKLIKKKGFTTV